jgi:type I restriction enzyme M protein
VASDLSVIENELWRAADQLRANAGILPSQYARPVMGLLFLRYADQKFSDIERDVKPRAGSRVKLGPDAYKSKGGIYLTEDARFARLLSLPEDGNLGKALTTAMREIEKYNPELADVLPKDYQSIPDDVLVELLRILNPLDFGGDAFGHVYEYFMGAFAKETMQKGGEFYTPASVVKLIVEILEPYHGRILDPACGSGGMFVHSADFVRRHQKSPDKELSIYGVERTRETWRLAQMNLAVHGLSGKILDADTYRDPIFEDVLGFDFVMANPPFNVSELDKSKLYDREGRYPFGVPTVDNANYVWISLFRSKLNETGRAGFVMANSAVDARGSEQTIRQKLVEEGSVDVIVITSSNLFMTVTLPCTLWFLDRAKANGPRADLTLFIDARQIYQQVDRARREFTDAQIESLANVVRLWRKQPTENVHGSDAWLRERFPDLTYRDVEGLCRVATRAEIEAQGWSLNPGRYVGQAQDANDDFDFKTRLGELREELQALNLRAAELQELVTRDIDQVLNG